MIVGKDLETWLADKSRQCRTQAAVDGFARAWRSGPIHRQFDDALTGLPEQSAEAIAEAMRGLFADHRWVGRLIDRLARALGDDPFFDPPFPVVNSDIHNGLLVFQDPRVSIVAGVSGAAQLAAKKNGPRGPTSVSFTGQMAVVKFVHAGDALLSFWEAPRITAGFSAGNSDTCARTGERRLADGDIVTIDGRRQSFVIEHARSNLVMLQASIAQDQAPLSVEYDSATLSYVGCSATGDSASRIQMLATLLRKLDCEGAFEPVAAFLDHPDFFVRWHLMKELLGIDAEAALPHLKRMAARDPHPEPRRAARAVLDRLAAPRPSKAA
jgi:hypothetical protein